MVTNAAWLAAVGLLLCGAGASACATKRLVGVGADVINVPASGARGCEAAPPVNASGIVGRWRLDASTVMKDHRPGKARSAQWGVLSTVRGGFVDLLGDGRAITNLSGGGVTPIRGVWQALPAEGVVWILIDGSHGIVVLVKRGEQIVDAGGRLWCRQEIGPSVSLTDVVGEWRIDANQSKQSFIDEGRMMNSLLAPDLRYVDSDFDVSMNQRFRERWDHAVIRLTIGQDDGFLRWSLERRGEAPAISEARGELWTDGVLFMSGSGQTSLGIVRGDELRVRLFGEPEVVFRKTGGLREQSVVEQLK